MDQEINIEGIVTQAFFWTLGIIMLAMFLLRLKDHIAYKMDKRTLDDSDVLKSLYKPTWKKFATKIKMLFK